MSIPAISGSLNVLTTRQGPTDASAAELQQARTTQFSTTGTQTEQAPTAPQKADLPREQLEDATKQVNEFLRPVNSAIQFSLDDDTGRTVVKIIDTTTKEVLRQVPSEEMLRIAQALDKIAGVLIQQKA